MKYLFEVSWEVCNLVGGIHTVLRMKAPAAIKTYGNNYYLLGPLLEEELPAEFVETEEPEWKAVRQALEEKHLNCKLGRWKINGNPKVALVEFKNRYNPEKVLFNYWQQFGVDSLAGGWDYIEPVLFSTACGEVIETIIDALNLESHKTVAHFHEWMTGGGLLYLKKNAPEIGTVFTTHATILGRTMAGAGLRIFSDEITIDPAQDAKNFGVQAKYAMEATCAREADVFTTVSQVTADESAMILEQTPHFVVCDGLDAEGLPDFEEMREHGHRARKELMALAEKFLNRDLPKNTRLFSTSGRYEFRNKGYDIFLEALARLDEEIREDLTIPPVVAWFMIATENAGLIDLENANNSVRAMCTHMPHRPEFDPILQTCQRLGLHNSKENKVHIIFTPAYLDGNDGFINKPYSEVQSAFDVGVFPSYYEPWGYTPLECIASGVPAITSDMAGFGRWIKETERDRSGGVFLIERCGREDKETAAELAEILSKLARIGGKNLGTYRLNARKAAESADWGAFYRGYLNAYERAYDMVEKRLNTLDTSSFSDNLFISYRREDGPGPHYQTFTVPPTLPREIEGLRTIAGNMWWVWHPDAQELFEKLDPEEWRKSKSNPVKMLGAMNSSDLEDKVRDRAFMDHYHRVQGNFEKYIRGTGRQYEDGNSVGDKRPIVYFSMEFGLHECLPIYSGGLGILAGDHLKAASDLGLPLVGVGFLYKQGYFQQRIDRDGNQQETYPLLDTANMPVSILRNDSGGEERISVYLVDRYISARVWKVNVGRVPLYLLDTDVEENRVRDRGISAKLYGGDRSTRIEQEIILGFGGVQLMEDKLRKKPALYHLNEGHCGFALFERMRRFIEKGLDFPEAREAVKATSVFTTHTPVPAGNEEFDRGLMTHYFAEFAPKLGIAFEQLLEMGLSRAGSDNEPFSMTVLALKLTSQANAVSKLHGVVCRDMWRSVWRDVAVEEVPIGAVTNGVHVTSWIGRNMRALLDKHLGLDWDDNQDDASIWENVRHIPSDILWYEHMSQKHNLIEYVKKKVLHDYVKRGESASLISDTLKRLDPKALTIGFARRFATYKRGNLLFNNREALKKLLSNPDKPVQLLFAGKAHPADPQGKALIRRIIEESRHEDFRGKIIYLENYDMALGRMLTQGVDVWLNNPIRPHEASGTSGMKTIANGGLNCSILDGWWDEAYAMDRKAGWAIQSPSIFMGPEHRDEMDSAALMSLLEHDIVPLFFDVNERGVPMGWVEYMKNAMRQFAPEFSTTRMVDEYHRKMYLTTAIRGRELTVSEYAGIKRLTEWKRKIGARFSTVQIDYIAVNGNEGTASSSNVGLDIAMYVTPGKLRPEELRAELVIGIGNGERFTEDPHIVPFDKIEVQEDSHQIKFSLTYKINRSGGFMYAVRVVPVHELLVRTQETGLVLWA